MRIHVLQSIAGADYSFTPGDHETSDQVGSELIRAGLAVEQAAEQIEIAAVEPAERAVKPRGRPRKTVVQ
jgi:hypothetical protein